MTNNNFNNEIIETYSTSELLKYLYNNIDFLSTTNKNYTQKQYFDILECKEITEELKKRYGHYKKINMYI